MKTILIVEDERNLRTLYSQELRAEGYEVIAVSSSHEALQQVNEHAVDLAVVDIKLGDESGLELSQKLMNIKQDIKIILNSAYSRYMSDFKSWSADAYLVKSSDLTELISKVRELTSGDMLTAEA